MKINPDLEKIKQFLIENVQYISSRVETGDRSLNIPKFDFYPRDYLQIAEDELNKYLENNNSHHLMNCISYLKRGLDCQLDIFLEVYNIAKVFKKKNLKIDKKLEFLKAAGVFSTRSLSRLNAIRNSMEHNYTLPKITDIELYFDVVSGFVATLERTSVFARNYYMVFEIKKDGWWHTATDFEYDFDKPSIQFSYSRTVTLASDGEDFSLRADLENYEEFAFLFKVMLLLIQQDRYLSTNHVKRILEND